MSAKLGLTDSEYERAFNYWFLEGQTSDAHDVIHMLSDVSDMTPLDASESIAYRPPETGEVSVIDVLRWAGRQRAQTAMCLQVERNKTYTQAETIAKMRELLRDVLPVLALSSYADRLVARVREAVKT